MTESSPLKTNTVHFKEWMTAMISVTKTDTTSRDGWLQLEW